MMITRCPECATAFRISGDQLDARGGQVRCGRCQEVFDALRALETPRDDVREQLAREDAQTMAVASVEEAQEPAAAPTITAPVSGPDSSYEFEFGRQRRPKRVALGWSMTAALLLLALAAQALFHFRGALALLVPEAKPYIYTLCAELGCAVPLPRRAELVSIETSDLQMDPAHPGVMVLSATLRNRAAFPQDYPALELTLTNERDQPLARRVIDARAYLRREPEEGFAASSEQQVRLPLEAAALKASGYRLYLFYP